MYTPFTFLGLLATAMAAVIGEKPIEFRCGSENPPAEILAQAAAMSHAPTPLAAQSINIQTYFHVVTTQAKAGSVTQAQLNSQVLLFFSLERNPNMHTRWAIVFDDLERFLFCSANISDGLDLYLHGDYQ